MNYIPIGKIVAAAGVSGQLILVHTLGKKATLKKVKALFIEHTKDNHLPYFIEDSKIKTDSETYIQLEGISNREAAQKLVSKKVWLMEEDYTSVVSKKASLALLGYMLIENSKPIGIVQDVIEQPQQVLLQIDYKGKEAYIPLHEETLLNINHKLKQIEVVLPDGLLELYE